VRAAGFEYWTILKPVFLMDNFAEPKATRMFPHLRSGTILTALTPDCRPQMIAAEHVGAYALASLQLPERFNRRDVDLAAEAWTMTEVAALISAALQMQVVAKHVSPKEARAAGLFPGWVRTQEWTNEVGYRADVAAWSAYGVPLTSFAGWLGRHAGRIVVDSDAAGTP